MGSRIPSVLAAALWIVCGCSPSVWIGVGVGVALSGGGGGGGGGGVDLRITHLPKIPGRTALQGDTDVAVIQIRLEAVKNDVDVTSITFHADGSGDDSISGLSGVNLYEDLTPFNGDWDATDVLLQGPRQYSSDDGDITFTFGSPVRIRASTPQYWILVYDLGAAPGPPDYFCANLWDGDDVTAILASGGSARVSTGGSFSECVDIAYNPRIESVTPNQGPQAGGTTVAIVTQDFQDDFTTDLPNRVQFGGVDATNVTGTAPNTLSVTTPTVVSPGLVDVFVDAQSGAQATLAGGFEYVADCLILSIGPGTGPISGGTPVTIGGTGFEDADPALAVTFGGASATIVSAAPTQIDVTTPPGSAGPVDVTVTGTNTNCSSAGSFTYVPGPSLGSVTPNQGAVIGGDTATIVTQNFSDDFSTVSPLSVQFGGVTAASWNGIGPDTISAVTPAGAGLGLVDVFVAGPSGDQATLVGGFEYVPVACNISSIVPGAGPLDGGPPIAIGGGGFLPEPPTLPGVTFGGVPSVVDGATTDSMIICTPPPGAGFGPVTVEVTNSTGGVCQVIDGFTYDIVGIPDITFGGQGWVIHDNAGGANGDDSGNAITIDLMGRILVAGNTFGMPGSPDLAIWAYGSTGTLIPTFGVNGVVVHDGAAGGYGTDIGAAMTLDPAGRILVAGWSWGSFTGADMVIWAYLPDGMLDGTFGSIGGWVVHHDAAGGLGDDRGHGIILDGGKIFVTGESLASLVPAADLVNWRYNLDGTLDTTFGTTGWVTHDGAAGGGGDDIGRAVALDASGEVFVAGESLGANGLDMVIWAYDTAGGLRNTFGAGGIVVHDGAAGGSADDAGHGIRVEASGRILVAGRSMSPTNDDMAIWAYDSAGAPDTTFGAGGVVVHNGAAGGDGDDQGNAIAQDAFGRILVAGQSTNGTLPVSLDMAIWRYNPDGTPDANFGVGGVLVDGNTAGGNGDDVANDITIDPSGKILVTGFSRNAGGNNDMVIWRFK